MPSEHLGRIAARKRTRVVVIHTDPFQPAVDRMHQRSGGTGDFDDYKPVLVLAGKAVEKREPICGGNAEVMLPMIRLALH